MSLWFDASPGVDSQIRARFSATVEAAARGQHASWVRAPRPALAFVLLLDQFPRNIWRGTERAFAHDGQALAVARQAVAAGFIHELAPIERPFLTLPFQHSESLDAQRESVHLCREILETAPPTGGRASKAFCPTRNSTSSSSSASVGFPIATRCSAGYRHPKKRRTWIAAVKRSVRVRANRRPSRGSCWTVRADPCGSRVLQRRSSRTGHRAPCA